MCALPLLLPEPPVLNPAQDTDTDAEWSTDLGVSFG